MTIDGTAYREQIARITSTFLGFEGHGIWSVSLSLAYGDSSSQGFGPIGLAPDALLLKCIIRASGVESWEEVTGRTVMALRGAGFNGLVKGLKPLPTEKGEGFLLCDDGSISTFGFQRRAL